MRTSVKSSAVLLHLLVMGILALLASRAEAARGILTYEKIRADGGPIILAEVLEAVEAARPEAGAPDRTGHGYTITLKVHEVLRGDLKAETIRIPFSPKGYARTWEDDAKPQKGMKLLVFLAGGEGKQWNDYGIPDTIRSIEAFDAATVKTVRKILSHWAIQSPADQEKALRAGCLDDDRGFRLYCAGALCDRALRRGPEAPEVLSFLWEVYTDDRVDIDTWQVCDSTFQNTFRSFGWGTYEPRYAILRKLVDRTWKDKDQSSYQSLQGLLGALAGYCNHRGETLELLTTIANGAREDIGGGAALFMCRLYEFFPATKGEQAMNARLLARLVELMAKGQPGSAEGAATGVDQLVRELPKICVERPDLAELVRNSADKDYRREAKERLAITKRVLDDYLTKLKPLAVGEGPPMVQQDLAAHLGEKVRMVGKMSWERTPDFGTALQVNGCLVWFPDVAKWPFDFPPPNYVLATGTLAQAEDIPVFRYEKGKPFGQGLPVPEPYNLKDMSRRFLLRDAKWELIGKP